MITLKRLTKKFGRQTLSEVKPAPLSETVDHTVEVRSDLTPAQRFTGDCHSSSSVSSSDSEEEDEKEEGGNEQPTAALTSKDHRHLSPHPDRRSSELIIERISSAEKRKYSQYKCSTGSSSSASSSDDEIKEAFDNRQSPTRRQVLLHHTHRHAYHHQYREKHGTTDLYRASEHAAYMACHRPVRVVPVGYRKRSPKYFAQMSAGIAERPSLDFNKMHHSKRLVMVRRPIVIRHNSRVHSLHQKPLSLEVSLDISKHTFQPVLTQTS